MTETTLTRRLRKEKAACFKAKEQAGSTEVYENLSGRVVGLDDAIMLIRDAFAAERKRAARSANRSSRR